MSELEKVTAVDTTYDASEIQVLEGLEAVRKRPGMYIGSTSASGLHHLVYEIVDNAIDEALAGYCTEITVTINPGNTITVTDNGRGIPVDIQPKLGIPAVTVVYTVLHAGGKFGGEDSGYKVAGGLHGVGASVVNALSEWLTVRVRRDGAEYEQSFKRGKPDGDLKKIGAAASTGTTVTFKPDPEMFQETTLYRYETLLKRLREEAFLNAGVRITLTDERPESDRPQEEKSEGNEVRTETMCYEGGIRSFVSYLCERRDLTPLTPQVMYMKGEGQGAVAEVALQYYDNSYNELLLSFANNVHTPEGGTHEEGFKLALTRVLNEYGRAKGILKDKDENLSGPDAREGIIAIISVKLREPQFEGQTKAKLGNTFIKGLVSNVVYKALTEYFEENPAVAKAILEKATQAARARAAAFASGHEDHVGIADGFPDGIDAFPIGVVGERAVIGELEEGNLLVEEIKVAEGFIQPHVRASAVDRPPYQIGPVKTREGKLLGPLRPAGPEVVVLHLREFFPAGGGFGPAGGVIRMVTLVQRDD